MLISPPISLSCSLPRYISRLLERLLTAAYHSSQDPQGTRLFFSSTYSGQANLLSVTPTGSCFPEISATEPQKIRQAHKYLVRSYFKALNVKYYEGLLEKVIIMGN